MDFTLTDEQLVTNNQMIASTDGAAMIFAFTLDQKSRYRLVSASAGDQIQLYNAPLSNGGWAVLIQNEYQSTGELNITMPAGVGTFFGHYIILPCKNQVGRCKSVINPQRPREPIVIHFKTQRYFLFNQAPHAFTYVDLDLFSDVLGEGYGHGYIPLRDGTTNSVDGWQNMVFPANPYPFVQDD